MGSWPIPKILEKILQQVKKTIQNLLKQYYIVTQQVCWIIYQKLLVIFVSFSQKLGCVDNHFNENINTSYKNMALCTYEKFFTINPALLKNAV